MKLVQQGIYQHSPDSSVHGANMGPIWVLSAPDGPHVGPMNLAIWVYISQIVYELLIYILSVVMA